MRRLICIAFAAVVLFGLPRAASAQASAHCFFFNSTTPCRGASPMGAMPLVWQKVTFGPATFVKQKREAPRGVGSGLPQHGAHRVERSVIRKVEPVTIAALDCSSARVADMTLDPKFVRTPPEMPPAHGGVAVPSAAPCSQLKSELSHVVIRR